MSLNDPQWGRGSAPNGGDDGKDEPRREQEQKPQRPQRPSGDGPPDLDELWRDFNRKLSGLFGAKAPARRPNGSGDSGGGDREPRW